MSNTSSLPKAWTEIPLRYHPLQSALYGYAGRFAGVCCGRQSGKTRISMARIIRALAEKKPWSDPNYFYSFPTREQAKKMAWKKLKALVPPAWLDKDPNETELSITTRFGSTLFLVGADKPQRIEGLSYDGGIIDESSDTKPEVYYKSALPALAMRAGWCWRIGVPKRHGVGGASFKEFCDKSAKGELLDTRFFGWPSADIMTQSEIALMRTQLDDKDFNEQFGGVWESSTGLIFYAFSEVLNVSDQISYNPNRRLVIGSDFNVSPMAWIIGHRSPTGLEIFDELFIKDTSTQLTLDKLHEKYGNHKSGFEFFGDATGKARKTAAASSDYLQIVNDTRFANAQAYYTSSNPARVDRFAACNALFKNAANERRCKIHPRCKQLIADLTRRAYKPGTREPDDSGEIGHITDALGYVIHRLFPIQLNDISTAPTVEIILDGN